MARTDHGNLAVAPMPITPHLKLVHWGGLFIAILATVGLPLVVLAADYYMRATFSDRETWWDLVEASGPDCCILSLGSTGAILLDPVVRQNAFIQSPLFVVFLIVGLFVLRVACIKAKGAHFASGKSTLGYGLWSISSIGLVIACGYIL